MDNLIAQIQRQIRREAEQLEADAARRLVGAEAPVGGHGELAAACAQAALSEAFGLWRALEICRAVVASQEAGGRRPPGCAPRPAGDGAAGATRAPRHPARHHERPGSPPRAMVPPHPRGKP